MNLDNLKEAWQEAEIKTSIDEGKIQRMIDNKGRGAFNTILRYEKIGLVSSLVCIVVSFVFKDILLIGVYLGSVVLALIWQFYKLSFLKKIDFSVMNILDISTQVAKYKKMMSREIIIGCIWGVLFLLLFAYRRVLKDILPDIFNSHLPLSLISIAIAFGTLIFIGLFLFLVWGLYKTMYIDNIKRIEQSIKEVEDFEEDQ